ncbi:hypothetical protein EYF80_022224 [Liparis tanakae]|uniref:Uncharacterized protein n=1 Tax=Liparis tanakae TaxID=230148 RepID=A0A4Z2HPP5_9TELE|nr:hypothetical protein EYF80_022224 [Liparis tanakae]
MVTTWLSASSHVQSPAALLLSLNAVQPPKKSTPAVTACRQPKAAPPRDVNHLKEPVLLHAGSPERSHPLKSPDIWKNSGPSEPNDKSSQHHICRDGVLQPLDGGAARRRLAARLLSRAPPGLPARPVLLLLAHSTQHLLHPSLLLLRQSAHELIVVATLLQEDGGLGLQRLGLRRQGLVPGSRRVQLLPHVVVVLQECLVVRRDPLFRGCGAKNRFHISKLISFDPSTHNHCSHTSNASLFSFSMERM